jgi:fido (protein-threonine AMPylation protein)
VKKRSTLADIARQLDQLEALIRAYPDGIGLTDLSDAYTEAGGAKILDRTMRRRLEALQKRDRVRSEGAARATRYYALPVPKRTLPTPTEVTGTSAAHVQRAAPETEEGYVPLSPEGVEVRALIRRPISARQPIGYDEQFIRSYQPGETWYLPEEMRGRLHEMGRTPNADRPAGTFARDVFERLLIDLAWASSRLEGNTYSRLDTKNLLEYGVRAEGKDAAEAQMILNHKRAIELLVDQAEGIGFNRQTLLTLHAALAENLLDDRRDEGRIRTRMVQVTGTTYMPIAIPHKLEELLDLLLTKAAAVPDPFEQAFFVMVHVPYLQPFVDVNKRTSRLAANLPLITANLCPLSFVDVPELAYVEGTLAVYENTRVELLRDVLEWAYGRSCAQYRVVQNAMGVPDPIRLRYRAVLAEVVQDVVQAGRAPRLSDMRSQAKAHDVPAADLEAFAEIALGLLVDLHEGAVARYGLRPSEFRAWKAQVTTGTPPSG